jgi:acetyl esterase/lipase
MIVLVSAILPTALVASEPTKVINLWPSTAPGDKSDIGEEQDTTKSSDHMVAGKRVARIGNVSKPTISIYKPAADKDTGSAVVVCPGGAYRILAIDLEGSEVCEWLNSIGITGVLLKYRVPSRKGLEKHTAALQDAQRALGLIRSQAKEFGINLKRIGVLGFSAGGHLAASLSNNFDQRSYPKVDDADDASCRPDFTLLIYPAYLTIKEENDKVAPELKVTTNTPPTFIAMTEDDPLRVETPMFYSLALRKANVPFELHLYPKGGHGYGLRPSTDNVSTWPRRAAEWIEKVIGN